MATGFCIENMKAASFQHGSNPAPASQGATCLINRAKGAAFWLRTKRVGDCLEWTGPLNNAGYGLLYHNGVHTTAHRVAWILSGKKIKRGLIICHHCDNPPCVNPEHLFMGTHRDNSLDAQRKGRLGIKKYPYRFRKNYRDVVEAPRFNFLPKRWSEELSVLKKLRGGIILFQLVKDKIWTYKELRDIMRRHKIPYIEKGDRPGSIKSLGKSYPGEPYVFPKRVYGKSMKLSANTTRGGKP